MIERCCGGAWGLAPGDSLGLRTVLIAFKKALRTHSMDGPPYKKLKETVKSASHWRRQSFAAEYKVSFTLQ